MTLDNALQILARIHTGWDEEGGLFVVPGAYPVPPEADDYVKAWKAVRMHLNLNINPSPTPVEARG